MKTKNLYTMHKSLIIMNILVLIHVAITLLLSVCIKNSKSIYIGIMISISSWQIKFLYLFFKLMAFQEPISIRKI
jgi:hypothetical protein